MIIKVNLKTYKIHVIQNADAITKYTLQSLNQSGSKSASVGAYNRYDIY